MQPVRVAKEDKVRGEVERIQIRAAIGQAIGRDAHRIEAEYQRAVGQIGLNLRNDALGIECRDKDRARAAVGEFGDRLR